MGNVVVVDLDAVGAELFDGPSEEAGVEGGDAVDDECDAQGLGRLVGELAVAHSCSAQPDRFESP